ncbi:hypothetical protein [Kordiimonas laminariae]|uniref:hypothetical protein n=1 Tax=Kordiimonas laminariae TaxID=2917717 RepID=UPI001FF145CE|nr:hypothetical protein [Kordiimonas laminariae]MCK0069671.1 hypothetical protein [Kordiimonas laminariae]
MQINLEKNDILLLIAAALTVVGAFGPMINLAGIDTVSYADAASPEVYALVVLALAAPLIGLFKDRKFSLFAAIGAWLVLLWPVLKNIGSGGEDDGGLLGKITDAAADPLQKVTEQIFSNVLDFEWGGYAFLIGMILLLVGSVRGFMGTK